MNDGIDTGNWFGWGDASFLGSPPPPLSNQTQLVNLSSGLLSSVKVRKIGGWSRILVLTGAPELLL